LDNNSFVIFKRGSLAIDSGVNEYSSHRANYYSRSVAHNTILVYDQDEDFPDAVWSSLGTGGSNDGGQRRVAFPTRVRAPDDHKAVRDIGRITAFVNREPYCYACGDATESYSPKKLGRFTRQFVHLRPDTFVVFDRVDATSASYPKTWLLHSIDEPVFPKTGSSFRVEQNGGRLDVWTLLPQDGATTAIGGSGKEYWVNGENYPPHETRDSEAGAWRVEVKPTRESASDLFLHVLIASDVGQSLPQVKLGSRDGQTAVVEIAGASRKATLQFRATGQTGGHVTIVQDGRTTVDDPLPAEVVQSE
jgi:heparin/heparan-sulfate lyase